MGWLINATAWAHVMTIVLFFMVAYLLDQVQRLKNQLNTMQSQVDMQSLNDQLGNIHYMINRLIAIIDPKEPGIAKD